MKRRRARPLIFLALGAFVGFLAVVAAWAIDSRAQDGGVLPNAEVADKSVRGMDRDELAAWVHTTAERFATAAVEVRTAGEDGGGFEATVPELGVAVDEERTVADALDAGRKGALPARVWRWVRSFISPIQLPVAIKVDRATLDRVVAERDRSRTPPTEPDLEVKGDRLEGVAGKNGRGVDPEELAEALARAEPTTGTLQVTLDIASIPPRFTKADADRLAAEAEEIAKAGLQVGAGGKSAAIPAESLRSWLRAVPGEESLQLGLRADAEVAGGLAELLPDAGTRPVDAGFTVSGGRVSITAPRTGTACCSPQAAELIDAALRDPAKRAAPVDLPLKSVPAARDEEAARKLGIVEQIGTFTTPHAAGEPRVTNIHLMADTIRGTVIPPGATFSINGTVGMRTKEKGYVEAPIISGDYKFEADVGGGVSQFATTMFNAAFFAGLDITEYAMHGLYISRYPYGREATLSFPGPDLKVRNSTPYGVLVWPTYTGSSITVTLYSTKFVTSSDQSNQVRTERPAAPPSDAPKDPPPEPPGPCVAVTTERTRVYLDGRSVSDRFSGLYAPAEGWSCPNRG
ncbi:MAG: VanW family protein [Acidimicrobiales bacterium]